VQLANRLQNFDAYLGTAMNLILTKMRTEGKDVINLGLGDPDVQPPEHLRRALADACLDVNHHHYPSFYSPQPLKEAMTNWYRRRFGSVLDPETEVLPLLGSAEGLFHIHSCLLDPGDVALVPDPAYPAYAAGVAIAGGVAVKVPLLEANGFLPDIEAIPQDVARRAKMIWVNYPNNPTSADANLGFYQQLVDWARRYDVAVIADNPYSEICFDDFCPPSFLMADGARDVGIEFNSLSKAYNCCGWRIGMALGNKEIISAMAKIKSHSDRGIYYPIQVAATAALNGPIDFMEGRNKMFTERRDVVVDALSKLGIRTARPKATFYVWAPVPKGQGTSKEFCFSFLEKEAVWMIPGSMYGQYGEGYFRIALTHPSARLSEAMQRLVRFLS
jgi:LL-diaminopimelate aminotransferase